MISKKAAQQKLLYGYIFAIIGFIAGASSDIFNPDPIISFLYAGYLFWATYLGWLIVYQPMKEFFSNLFVFRENLISLMLAYLMLKVFIFLIILISAAIVGTCGGAIYIQFKYSKIAYG